MANLKTRKATVANATSPIRSAHTVPNTRTALGGPGYLPADAKSELFDLAVVFFAGEDNFHESGAARDKRFASLVSTVAVEDPEWVLDMLTWLRTEGNVRTASLMGAVHAVHARLNDPASVKLDASRNMKAYNRQIIDAVCRRADEPQELLNYWISRFGKPVPQPVKRGVSDALARLVNEYTFMKWDRTGDAWRMGDAIEFVHAKPKDTVQASLFRLAIADRHGNVTPELYSELPMIRANKFLRNKAATDPNVLLNASLLKEAGFTWEDALSLAGNKLDKAALWEALIYGKSIPVFAMFRNLRNMEQAGVSREAMKFVCNYISNPEVIAKSGMFPFQIYAAHKNTNSVHWKSAIEDALTFSTQNVPVLSGRTLVLVDGSGSMFGTKLSARSELERVEAACVFGAAIAARNPDADVYTYSNSHTKVSIPKGTSMLHAIDLIKRNCAGGGTNTAGSLKAAYRGQDRVIIVTDEQSSGNYNYHYGYGSVSDQVPEDTYLYSFDLAGHRVSDIPSGKNRRHQLAGLTDKSFQIIPLLERGRNAGWPWEVTTR